MWVGVGECVIYLLVRFRLAFVLERFHIPRKVVLAKVSGFGFRVSGFGFRVGLRVAGSGCRVSGGRVQVLGFPLPRKLLGFSYTSRNIWSVCGFPYTSRGIRNGSQQSNTSSSYEEHLVVLPAFGRRASRLFST